jgi:hypothetical protein
LKTETRGFPEILAVGMCECDVRERKHLWKICSGHSKVDVSGKKNKIDMSSA